MGGAVDHGEGSALNGHPVVEWSKGGLKRGRSSGRPVYGGAVTAKAESCRGSEASGDGIGRRGVGWTTNAGDDLGAVGDASGGTDGGITGS